MNAKLLRRCLAAAVGIRVVVGIYQYQHVPLPRIRLKDGTEIRVLKVAYGTGANFEHELATPSKLKLRLIHLLPQSWQHSLNLQNQLPHTHFIYSNPMVAIWWTYNFPSASADPARSPSNAIITADTNVLGWGLGHTTFSDSNGNTVHGYPQSALAPGQAYQFLFRPLPEQDEVLTIYMKFNGELVPVTVPIPPPSE